MSPNSKGVEILSIGTELLLGNIINTNAQWISEQLSLLGLNHFRQSTVGDNCERIMKVIQEILDHLMIEITEVLLQLVEVISHSFFCHSENCKI